jgi:hypothetical protein
MDNNKLAAAYVNIREARKQATREYEARDAEFKAKLDLLGAHMLKVLTSENTKSIRTEAGTFFRKLEVKPSATDWERIYQWIKENDAFEFLEKRLTKTAVVNYMVAHDDEIPPGMAVHREYIARVRANSWTSEEV